MLPSTSAHARTVAPVVTTSSTRRTRARRRSPVPGTNACRTPARRCRIPRRRADPGERRRRRRPPRARSRPVSRATARARTLAGLNRRRSHAAGCDGTATTTSLRSANPADRTTRARSLPSTSRISRWPAFLLTAGGRARGIAGCRDRKTAAGTVRRPDRIERAPATAAHPTQGRHRQRAAATQAGTRPQHAADSRERAPHGDTRARAAAATVEGIRENHGSRGSEPTLASVPKRRVRSGPATRRSEPERCPAPRTRSPRGS